MGYARDKLQVGQARQAGGEMDVLYALVPSTTYVIGAPDRIIEIYPMFVQVGQSLLRGRVDFMTNYTVILMKSGQQFLILPA
jgi:hypothetical protein